MSKQHKIPESHGQLHDNDDQIFLIDHSGVPLTLSSGLEDLQTSDEFQEKVAKKSSQMCLGRQAAELEVLTDFIVTKTGSVNKALPYVIQNITPEYKLQAIMNNLIHLGAHTSFDDPELGSPLHLAVAKNMKGITAKLLENGATPQAFDKHGKLPLETAMNNKNDDMCALLLAYMPNFFVRSLFLKTDDRPAKLSFHELLHSRQMRRTIHSVLDCMMEAEPGSDSVKVFYSILECDDEGRPPDHKKFNPDSKTGYQIIAKQGIKSIVYHNAVRLLTRRKWKKFARRTFQFHSILYLISLLCLTFSAVVGAMTPNPNSYQSNLQLARAVVEVISIILVSFTVLIELMQFKRRRFEYFKEPFNWFEATSSILLFCVIPLRFTDNNAQWHVFAFGFLLWTIRIFKYAAVFRHSGAYAQILSQVLVYDFVQFGVVFLVILLAFSVSFHLSLRGDMDLHVHNETSTVSVVLMLCFLFTCIVILLNMLIAQLTDTYQQVQQDAQRGLEVNRAWIVARTELNGIFRKIQPRTTFYVEYKNILDMNNVLIKWESSPMKEMNRTIRDIWDSLASHKLNLLTVQQRQARQDITLQDIHTQLGRLVELHLKNKEAQTETRQNNISKSLIQSCDENSSSGQEN